MEHQLKNGAVIDYIMMKEDQEELLINKMEIRLREESDHLPIELEIKKKEGREKMEETNETKELGWKWREEKKEEYQRIIEEKWEHRREKEEGNIKERLEDFMEMIREAAGAGMKKGGNKEEYTRIENTHKRKRKS